MMRKTARTVTTALTLYLSCIHTIVVAALQIQRQLQLQQSWQAAPGSILATAQVSLSTIVPVTGTHGVSESRISNIKFLATAGHDGGTVTLWKLPSVWPETDGEDVYGVYTGESKSLLKPHGGSVFALESFPSIIDGNNILVSGSFDRSAQVQRIRFTRDNNGVDTLTSKTIASLPEHTGWVRGVRMVEVDSGEIGLTGINSGAVKSKSNKADSDLFFLSIGCNLINVWTTSSDDTQLSQRLARLDGGPSPLDPLDEPFRRHDILAIDVAKHYKSDNDNDSSFSPWIVAGLVDGTLRVFKTKWGVWKSRTRNLLYDSTGSCSKTVDGAENDELPICSIQAHDGRVTGVHAVACTNFVVSVGYDGFWRQWKIDLDLKSVELVAFGHVIGGSENNNNPTKNRICSSAIVPQSADSDSDAYATATDQAPWSLIMGTAGGQIYRVLASELGLLKPSTSELIWSEKDASITALTYIGKCATDSPGTNGIFTIAAGTSKGVVRLFA